MALRKPAPSTEQVTLADDVAVPRLIVGAWQLSEGHSSKQPDRDTIIDAWLAMADAGLTTFDCADIYTGVETLLGEFVQRARQRGGPAAANIRIHTKFVPDRDVLPGITKQYVERIIDRSLTRLGVDRLDLVQFAWWDYTIPRFVDAARWLDELRRAGKIHHLGATNFDVPHLAAIVDAGVPIVSHQVQYSVLDHRPERGMVHYCRENGIQLLCYGTLAGGFLSDRYVGAVAPPAPLANRSLIKYRLVIDECGGWEAFQELLDRLHEVARKHDVQIGNVAVRYVLDKPQVASAIVGTRSGRHLRDNLKVVSLRLDDDDIARIEEVCGGWGPAGDVYEAERLPESSHAAIMRYNLNREAPFPR